MTNRRHPNRTAASVAAWRRAAEADAERWRRLEARAAGGELDGWRLNPPDDEGADDEGADDDDDQEEAPRTRRNPPAGPGALTWIAGAIIAGAIGAWQNRRG
jgi:hypothetical protein